MGSRDGAPFPTKMNLGTHQGEDAVMADVSRITSSLSENGILCSNSSGVQVTTGGIGPKPGELLLMAVAGCSALNMKAALAKDGLNPAKIDIAVDGVYSEDRPRRFSEVKLHYTIVCPGLTDEKAAHYVKATEEHCFVTQSISSVVHSSYTLAG